MELLYIATALFFLSFPEASSEAAEISCLALKNVVVKSLFPMMVLSRLIARSPLITRIASAVSKSLAWRALRLSDALIPSVLSGLLSGLPSSASEIERLKKQGSISDSEAKKALALASLPSPAFVILVASESLIVGVVRFLLIVFSSYAVTLLSHSQKSVGESHPSPLSFGEAIRSSAMSAVFVSANIIFFSAITCLSAVLVPTAKKALAVFFEMGCGIIFADGDSLFCAMTLGWCGLSALCQLRTEAPSVSASCYIKARALSALLLTISEILQKYI